MKTITCLIGFNKYWGFVIEYPNNKVYSTRDNDFLAESEYTEIPESFNFSKTEKEFLGECLNKGNTEEYIKKTFKVSELWSTDELQHIVFNEDQDSRLLIKAHDLGVF